MTPERILGALIEGALGGRRKRHGGALRYLTGGRGSLINASTLMTAAGLAWGAYEAATRSSQATAPSSPPAGGAGAWPPMGGLPGGSPNAPQAAPAATPAMAGHMPPPPALPPLPGAGLTDLSAPLPVDLLRAVRLTISAARVDGTLSRAEHDQILAKAQEVGATHVVQQEIEHPRPLAEIVGGVSDPAMREDLYSLAFGIVRADETVSGAERIYLAQLAHHLGLDPGATQRLENEAVARIDEQG